MKTFPQPMSLVGSLALLAGCASDALNVQGSAVLTSTVAGQTPTRMGFDFTARVTALEAGSGFTGAFASAATFAPRFAVAGFAGASTFAGASADFPFVTDFALAVFFAVTFAIAHP